MEEVAMEYQGGGRVTLGGPSSRSMGGKLEELKARRDGSDPMILTPRLG